MGTVGWLVNGEPDLPEEGVVKMFWREIQNFGKVPPHFCVFLGGGRF